MSESPSLEPKRRRGRKRGEPSPRRRERNLHQRTAGVSKGEAYFANLSADVDKACTAWLKRRGITVKPWREPKPEGMADSEAETVKEG